MTQFDGVQVSFQKRTTKGLDQYEHEQASATLNVTLDEGEDVHGTIADIATAVRGPVLHTLGLANAPSVGETRRPDHPEKTPAHPEKTPTQQARDKAAPSHPDSPPKDESGKPMAPESLKNVKGQNAVKLAEHLKAVYDAGNPVPDAQIYRLPKGWQTDVRNYFEGKGDAQESAGSHDDPPIEGGADNEEEALTDPLEGAGGDTPDEGADATGGVLSSQEGDTEGDEDIDDLMSGNPQPPQEDVSDARLQEKLREFKSRFGGAKEIKAALETFAGKNGGAGDIPTKDRPQFLQTLEQRAVEKGV